MCPISIADSVSLNWNCIASIFPSMFLFGKKLECLSRRRTFHPTAYVFIHWNATDTAADGWFRCCTVGWCVLLWLPMKGNEGTQEDKNYWARVETFARHQLVMTFNCHPLPQKAVDAYRWDNYTSLQVQVLAGCCRFTGHMECTEQVAYTHPPVRLPRPVSRWAKSCHRGFVSDDAFSLSNY